jgi:YD repeat-containing protein
MVYKTEPDMRAEHELWSTEHASWGRDTEEWKREISHAIEELVDVKGLLEDHQAALNVHLESIRQHEATETEHERVLIMSDVLKTPPEHPDLMTSVHNDEATKHSQQRDAHERMKRHHRSFVTTWSLMVEALRRAL